MIKYIYFDFGGIFVNYDKALEGICKHFNLDFDEFLDYYYQFSNDLNLGSITTEEYWQKCIEKFKLENTKDFDVYKSWVNDYKIIKPMHEFAYSIEKIIDIGIISNISSGLWEASVKYGLTPNIVYKNVLLSYQLGIKKPDPGVFELAQKEAKVDPKEILFIDDQEKNLIYPREIGWKIFQFDQYNAEEGLEKIKRLIE